MSRRLISRNADLKRLWDEGYEVDVRSAFLLITNIPYVTSTKELAYGTLVSELSLAGDTTIAPTTHVVHFAGDYPCDRDGRPLTKIQHQSATTTLDRDLVVHHSFSSKPPTGYRDYYEKMMTYAAIISGPAQSLHPQVTPLTFGVHRANPEESPFHYLDTASSRASIGAVTRKLQLGAVAIVGLGGTGSYVLDLVAKTPVTQIHLFDGDAFAQHNAFRSPGAPSIDELLERPSKVAYHAARYSRMHRGIVAHERFLDASNAPELLAMDFVFLCLDGGGTAKVAVVDLLQASSVPFVDVGMGIYQVDDALGGLLRVTTSTPDRREHVGTRLPASNGPRDDDYSRNIQIADLNALNASLAVVRWKKLFGFYSDLETEHHATYTIDGNMLTNDEQA